MSKHSSAVHPISIFFELSEDYLVREVRIHNVSMNRLIFHIRITAGIF